MSPLGNMAVTCGKSYDGDIAATAVVVAEDCLGFEGEDMAYIGRTRPLIHDFAQGWTMKSMFRAHRNNQFNDGLKLLFPSQI